MTIMKKPYHKWALHQGKLVKTFAVEYTQVVKKRIEFKTTFPFVYLVHYALEDEYQSVCFTIPGELGNFKYSNDAALEEWNIKINQAAVIIHQFSLIKDEVL